MASPKPSSSPAKASPGHRLGIPKFAETPAYAWITRWADRVLIAGFSILLVVPGVVWFFGWNPYDSLGENRPLAPPPSLQGQPLATWPAAIDTYFRDNFGLRNAMVHANSVVMRMWLRIPSDQLVIGKDGWAFFHDSDSLKNYLGLDPLTDQQLKIWKSYLETRRKRWDARHVKSLFVIAPDKQSIYPEMLPYRLGPRGKTRLDQLVAHLQETRADVNLVDLRPVLLAAKKDGLVYFPHDSHWNGRGYFAAYREISRRLREWFPDLPVQSLGTGFSIKRIPSTGGDWGLVGLPEENGNYPSDVLVPMDGQRIPTVPPELPAGVPNPVAPWLAALRTENPNGKRRLLLVHDSFMGVGGVNRAEGPLTRDFKTTLSIGRLPEDRILYELEDSFHPDVVIEQIVERHVLLPRP